MLYGTFGTGKTTLAKMLPECIEMGRTDGGLNMPKKLIGCQQGFNGPESGWDSRHPTRCFTLR